MLVKTKSVGRSASTGAGRLGLVYHPFQNHYTHEIIVFELFRGLQLQLSGVFRIKKHYSYSFLMFLAECSYRKEFPSGILKNILQLQLHDLMVFELKI